MAAAARAGCAGWGSVRLFPKPGSQLIFPILLLIASLSIPTACAQQQGVPASSVTQVHEALTKKGKTDIIVLDVRTTPELTGPLGKLDNIVHIPLNDLSSRIKELSRYSSSEIHVICRSGNRSTGATEFLRKQGYNAFNVEGGMQAWRKKFGSAGK